MVVDLGHPAALPTDQELGAVGVGVLRALDTGNEGSQTFDLVDKPLFLQELQRAVDRRRCGGIARATQLVEQRIGAHRLA